MGISNEEESCDESMTSEDEDITANRVQLPVNVRIDMNTNQTSHTTTKRRSKSETNAGRTTQEISESESLNDTPSVNFNDNNTTQKTAKKRTRRSVSKWLTYVMLFVISGSMTCLVLGAGSWAGMLPSLTMLGTDASPSTWPATPIHKAVPFIEMTKAPNTKMHTNSKNSCEPSPPMPAVPKWAKTYCAPRGDVTRTRGSKKRVRALRARAGRLRLVYDSGATHHFLNTTAHFVDYHSCKGSKRCVRTATGKGALIRGYGTAVVNVKDCTGSSREVILENAMHCPDFVESLVSLHQLTESGFKSVFSKKEGCWVEQNVQGNANKLVVPIHHLSLIHI